MKLPHIITNKSKLVYRRRIPRDLTNDLPKTFFETRLREQQQGPALVAEHSALNAAFERLITDARRREPEAIGVEAIGKYIATAYTALDDPRTERVRWEDARKKAEALVSSVQGLAGSDMHGDGGEETRREVLAEELARTKADPLLYRAVVEPEAAPPEPTLADAVKVYAEEKLGENPSKSARNTFNKIKRRLETSLGPLDRMPLASIRREHAKKVRDDLLKSPKKGGGILSVASVQREINSMKSLVNVGIREHDLKGVAFNPFESLQMPATASKGPQSEWEQRDPFPDDVLVAVRRQVMTRTRIPELRLIWRLLQTTGCRGAEITGLRVEDLDLEHSTPHIWVRWHDDRRVKNKTSIRPVPLVGDGLIAAQEALERVQKTRTSSLALIPRYAHEGGPDAASGALMDHVRKVTENPRHVVYSLRHNIKSWLGQTGASERDENRILGHAEAAVGSRIYGGLDDRLLTTSKALKRALAIAPEDAWKL